MKTVTVNVEGISQGQWSTFLLELNLMKKAWKPVGVEVQLITPQLKKVLAWGTRKHDEPYEPTYKGK